MIDSHAHGHTRSGQPITDPDVETVAAEAEAGYDIDELPAPAGPSAGAPRSARPQPAWSPCVWIPSFAAS